MVLDDDWKMGGNEKDAREGLAFLRFALLCLAASALHLLSESQRRLDFVSDAKGLRFESLGQDFRITFLDPRAISTSHFGSCLNMSSRSWIPA